MGDNLGYNLCFATATPSMSRRIVPLRMTMWAAKEEGFTSENDKVLDVIRDIVGECEMKYHQGKIFPLREWRIARGGGIW